MTTKTLESCKKIAKEICTSNLELRTAHVAFLVRKGVILSLGWNTRKTHPKVLKHPYHEGALGTHAELKCIVNYGLYENFTSTELLVLRYDRNEVLNISRPCEGCQSVIKMSNIKHVYYSNEKGDIVYEFFH